MTRRRVFVRYDRDRVYADQIHRQTRLIGCTTCGRWIADLAHHEDECDQHWIAQLPRLEKL